MARRSGGIGEPELREWITACRSDFRLRYTNVMLGDSAEMAQFTWDELSKAVDPLEAGKAVRIHRYELPDGHLRAPPHGGHPCDSLILGADDVLRDAPRTAAAPRVPPYRRTQDLDL